MPRPSTGKALAAAIPGGSGTRSFANSTAPTRATATDYRDWPAPTSCALHPALTMTILHRRQFLQSSLLGASALALAGGPLPTSANTRQKVNLLAGNKGSTSALYPHFLRSNVVDVSSLDIQYVGSAPGQMQLQLLSGAINVSGYGALGIAEANAKGADITLFAPFDHNHSSWIVRGDSPYKSIHDLKGKRVATLPINTDTVRQAELSAALHGLDLKKDFQMSYGPALVSLALFERGDVDAIIAIEPNSTRLVAKGAREIVKVRDLWTQATGDPSFFLVGWAASAAWLKAN